MKIEQWVREMFRRGNRPGRRDCGSCPSLMACGVGETLCAMLVDAWHEAGVVPVVTAAGERMEG